MVWGEGGLWYGEERLSILMCSSACCAYLSKRGDYQHTAIKPHYLILALVGLVLNVRLCSATVLLHWRVLGH